MSLRKSTRKELVALGLHFVDAPPAANQETWFISDDQRFVAVLWRHLLASNW
jgi:hypothetical protein